MKLEIYRSLWGMTGTLDENLTRIAEAGIYVGIEGFLDAITIPVSEFKTQVQDRGLKLIMAGAAATKEEIEPLVTQLAEFAPVKIGLHSGRDSMTREEGCAFFEEALRVEQQIGIPVSHETHRGRILFSPWDAFFYLRQFKSLKLVADYSHWVNVCERLPEDQAHVFELANQRAFHIHARIGYEQGPQVPDPAAPEYAAQRAWHEQQWLQIKHSRQHAGDDVLTLVPEYGPPPYQHTLPFTNAPVAENWRVCLWAAEQARQLLG